MKNNSSLSLIMALFLVLLITMACNLSLAATPTPEPVQTPTIILSTITSLPSETAPSPTLESSPTVTPLNDIEALVNVEFINLRDGPGTIFSIIATANKGSLLRMLHKAPGSDWVFVQTPQGQAGWASLAFISPQGALEQVPVKDIDFAYVISGKVIDENSEPIEGINIAISQQDNTNRRTDANTSSNGEFYAYLPSFTTGVWNVSVVGISCTSHIVTPPCEVNGHFSPDFIPINLTTTIPLITFKYTP